MSSHSVDAVVHPRPRVSLIAASGAAFVVALALTLWTLHLQLAGESLWHALIAPKAGNLRQLIVHDGTLPRVAISLICGAALALAGAVAQQVLRNPLAEPMTLGIFPGAYLALAAAAVWAPAWFAAQRELVALAGGGIAVCAVFALAWRQRLSSLSVILSGMIVSLYCGSLSMALAISHFQLLTGLMIWGGGALDQQGWQASDALLVRLGLAALAVFLLRRPLGLFDAGESTARGLGLSLARTRLAALGLAVALTACVVSAVGVIGFIGLAAPTLARLAGARRFVERAVWSPVIGALMLWLTDSAVQAVAASGRFGAQMIPTGALTSLLGAPMLLWLLRTLKSRPDLRVDAAVAATRSAHPWRTLAALWVATVVASLASLIVGRGPHGWHFFDASQIGALAFWHVPHLVAALSAGAMLGVSGTLIQRMTGNPVASPDLIGVSSGGAPGPLHLFVSCLAGAIVTLAIMLWFGRGAMFAPERLLLTGVAISALFPAVSGAVAASGDARAGLLLNFVVGSTYYVQPIAAAVALVVAIIGLVVAPMFARSLELLSLGDAVSQSNGMRVGRARLLTLLLAALLSATATLLIGPLSFVGLMAPHLARTFGMARAREQLLASASIGALLMVLASWLGGIVLFPYEMPAGLMAALIGGPYLVWALMRASPQRA
jgi:ferric hydroxamate transport system permease protein